MSDLAEILKRTNFNRDELIEAIGLWYNKAQSLTAERDALKDILDEIVNIKPAVGADGRKVVILSHKQIEQARKLVNGEAEKELSS